MMDTNRDDADSCAPCETLGEVFRENVRKRPYASLAMALGAGYILGGGLTSRTTVRAFGLGLKVAMLPFVQDRLLSAADVVLKKALKKTK
jgi:predicted lysophospholipase L1 biosynthesis ABC-type transport system permease subunit